MCKKLIYLTSFGLLLGLVLGISGQAMAAIKVAEELLVDLRAKDLVYGTDTTTWNNHGTLGDFTAMGTPVVEDIDGRKAVTFDSSNYFVGPPSVPGIEGDGTRSIEIWVYNGSDLEGEETMVSWGHRGGPDGTNIGFNYGDNGTFGAVGHWGAPDMGWSDPHSPAPAPENWWYLVYTYDGTTVRLYVNGEENTTEDLSLDTHGGTPIRVAAQADGTGDGADTGFNYTGSIAEVRIHDGVLSPSDIAINFISKPGDPIAIDPDPDDGQIEVLRNAVLSWEPGELANTHDVYLGTVFDDVNDADRNEPLDVLVSQGQNATTYEPDGRLDFGQTYYWRIDEVNAPPDSTIFKGDVWSFTTELFAYPIENITATASSSGQGQGPENTINGFGLDVNNVDLHSDDLAAMWLTAAGDPGPAWIQYDFDKVYKLYEMLVWNHNGTMEAVIGFGCKDVTIEYSLNGTDYTTLGAAHEFARGTGAADYAPNTTVDSEGVSAKYIRLTPNSNWGGLMPQYGLSEVRFLYIPAQVTEPSPSSGATDVAIDVILGWRAGREAAKHDVYLSADEQAVIDGTATVSSVTEASYGTTLDLGSTYYWRVDEVNDVETPTTWQGDVWDFSTQEYLVVDDFELYNDLNPDDPESNRIFNAWLDGYGDPTNGSLVGYADPPFAEKSIVSGGKQSMPFSYDNSTASYSEATANVANLQVGQDWTKGAPETLVLWIHGELSNAAAGQLYVKINDTKVMYDGDLSVPIWKQWNVDLASVGINLSNITALSIGVDSGGSGMLYVDDIALYRIAPPVVEPPPGSDMSLVGHWKLDETSGLIAADSSGYGNDGTLMNMTGTEWTAGIRDGALMFDGNGQIVDCGNPISLQLTGDVTISAWVKMEPANEDVYMGIGGKLISGPYNGFALVRHSSNVLRMWMGNDGGDLSSVSSDVTYNDTDWHHVVGVVSNNTGSLYVDGVKQAEEAFAGLVDTGDYAYIGKQYSNGTDRYWVGTIDDFRIYYRALSEQEILGL